MEECLIDNDVAAFNTSKGEEKSTIDKVFEELEIESETKTSGGIKFKERNPSLANIEPKSNSNDKYENDVENTRKIEIKTCEAKEKNSDSPHLLNLMQHIDVRQENDSVKTKEGVELVDLLEDKFNPELSISSLDISKQASNLFDVNPREIETTHPEFETHNVNNFIACEDKNSNNSKKQYLSNSFQKEDHVEALFDLSKASNHFPESSVEYNSRGNFLPDSSPNALGYHINHINSLESESSQNKALFSPHDTILTAAASLEYNHNEDFTSEDFNVDASDLLTKYKQMEAQQEMLNHSLISLSTHFAQVQLRLKQIINSPKHEQEELLRNLEKFTFIGIPEVNELCLYNYENSEVEETESEKANKSYIEEKLAFEKNKHKEMIGKLRTQLEALENYVYEFSNNDSAEIPTNQIISKQQIIINELKDKLNLNVNLSEEDQLREEINKSIINPMKSKEDLILQLKTQISDLEKFINFLQSTQCKCSNDSSQVDMKNKTITIMKKISTILHIFAEHHSSSFKKPTTVAAMKKSMKVNHYGDLRAQLEIAVNHVMDACRQPPDQDVPIDSDYMSDTEDPVPCNSKVALAVRKQLAPTLQRLLQHGLSSFNATQTVSVVQYFSCASSTRRHHASAHIWDLIAKYYEIKDGPDFNCKPNRKLSESFNLEIGNNNLGIKQSLLASIGNILAIHHKYKKFNPDSYFKSFVCDGLNKKLLVEWLLLILNYKTLASEVYSPWSYVASTQFSDAAQSLRRLYEFHFSLTIVDVTIRNLQSIKDAF